MLKNLRLDFKLRNDLSQRMENQWPGSDTQDLLKKFEETLKYSHLLSVFRLDPNNSSNDLDVAILKSLMKASLGHLKDQLNLAISWNRSDIARDYIFTEEKIWEV